MTLGHVIGLMSGTSADSIDAALVKQMASIWHVQISLSAIPNRPDVAQATYRARSSPETFPSDTDLLDALSRAIAEDHAEAVRRIARMANTVSWQLVGFHGQTIYHNPEVGQTVQLFMMAATLPSLPACLLYMISEPQIWLRAVRGRSACAYLSPDAVDAGRMRYAGRIYKYWRGRQSQLLRCRRLS